MNFWITWVLLSKDADVKTLENQFRAFEVKNISEKPQYQYSLQNLGDVYLGSANVSNSGITGNKSNVKLFSAIAFLIVLVAAINYIILSTAVSTGRRLEIGIRKTFGAINRSIKNQLLIESVLLALIVLPIALILMKIALPYAGKLFPDTAEYYQFKYSGIYFRLCGADNNYRICLGSVYFFLPVRTEGNGYS